MSGDTHLRLPASADSHTATLVAMLGRLPSEGLESFVVIGGLAVLCRVGSLYRATADIDTLIEDDGEVVAALRSRPSVERTTNGIAIDGTTIDVIEIEPIEDAAQLPDDADDRLFILSHRYAYDTATSVRIDVTDPDGSEHTTADVDVATPAALVATKLNSYPQRRGRGIAKQGSDLLDLLALIERYDDLASNLRSAPHGLPDLCAAAAERQLIVDADVAAGRIRRYTSLDWPAETIRSLAERFVLALSP